MKTRTMFLLVAGLACGAMFGFAKPAEEKPVWHSDWSSASRIAKSANKPIFAVLVCKH